MKNLFVLCIVLALNHFLYFNGYAQSHSSTRIRIERIPEITGSVVGIEEDHHGFMWFGGSSGLHRYDGYEVKTYPHDPEDERSLSDTMVETLLVDQEGRLWVATRKAGLNLFDADTETFIRYLNEPDDPTSISGDTLSALLEDRNGYLWVGTLGSGLNRFDLETETFKRYEPIPGDSTSLSDIVVRSLYEDKEGTIWVGTQEGGLNRYNPDTDSFTRYQADPENEHSLDDNMVRSISDDSQGRFWVGTGGDDGLHTMDRETGTFTRYSYNTSDPNQLSRPVKLEIPDPRYDFGVSFVYEDTHGRMWIGAYRGGLNVYNPVTETQSFYVANPSDPNSLQSNDVWTIHESLDGTIWIGTWSGVCKAVSLASGFDHYYHDPSNENSLSSNIVRGMYEDQEGIIWIASPGGGLNRFDPASDTFSHYRSSPTDTNSLSTDLLVSVTEGPDGKLWLGTRYGGIDYFDRNTGHFTNIPNDAFSLESLTYPYYFPGITSDWTIWVGTYGGGLFKMIDPENRVFKSYSHSDEESGSLSSDVIITTYEDRKGTLWIGTIDGGLNRYYSTTETFTHYLTKYWITTIFEDEAERFWIGTVNQGLFLMDRDTGKHIRYTHVNGLPRGSIIGIIDDSDGNLWISTTPDFGPSAEPPGRMSRFNPENEVFTNFGPEDGIPDIAFMSHSALQRQDGTLIFGGNGGFISFDPEEFGSIGDDLPPNMVLTDFRMHNDRIVPGESGPLDQAIYKANRITLAHRQNDFTIDYAGILYHRPGEIRYQHMLENHDREWVNARTMRNARYSGLPPGDYVFRVRAVSGKGVWSEEDATLAITILPPWWRTGWAYALWSLLLIGAVFGVYRVQHARIVRKEREMAQIREAELKAESAELRATSAELQARASETQARALAVENERNELELEKADAVRQQKEQLEQSHTIVAAINAETSFSRLLTTILEQCRVIPGVEKSSALVYYPDETAFFFRAASGWDVEEMKSIRMEPETARARYVENAEEVTEDIFVARDVTKRPGTEKLAEIGQVASFLVLRIRIDEKVAGYLIFDSVHDRDAFAERDVALLEGLREHIRSAFIKTRLVEDLQEKNEEVFKTLTDLKNAQRQLIQSEKMASLGELTAGIAHEIKNPLNFVNNFAEVNEELAHEMKQALLANKKRRIEEVLDDLDEIASGISINSKHISKHGKRADSIVNSMMQHAHASENRYRVEVNRLVDENIGLSYHGMRAQYPDLNVEIERSFDESITTVEMMPQEIGRVLINVLNNAFYVVHKKKQSISGTYEPKVNVETRQVESGVEIRIEDNGPGIPVEVKERIFEPFFTTKPTGSGTGLGLSLAYDIVTQGHGGTMTVECEEGKGATFVITLPN